MNLPGLARNQNWLRLLSLVHFVRFLYLLPCFATFTSPSTPLLSRYQHLIAAEPPWFVIGFPHFAFMISTTRSTFGSNVVPFLSSIPFFLGLMPSHSTSVSTDENFSDGINYFDSYIDAQTTSIYGASSTCTTLMNLSSFPLPFPRKLDLWNLHPPYAHRDFRPISPGTLTDHPHRPTTDTTLAPGLFGFPIHPYLSACPGQIRMDN